MPCSNDCPGAIECRPIHGQRLPQTAPYAPRTASGALAAARDCGPDPDVVEAVSSQPRPSAAVALPGRERFIDPAAEGCPRRLSLSALRWWVAAAARRSNISKT